MAGSPTVSPQLTTDILNAPSGIIADIIASATGIAKTDKLTKSQTNELVNTSIATSAVETGGTFNPDAVGDGGTSFGLFQLHEGGELGTLTQSQADNPTTNSDVAIAQIAAVLKAQGANESPGDVAAGAQRPANPTSYASDVNALLGKGSNTGQSYVTSGNSSSSSSSSSSGGLGGILAKIGGFLLALVLIGVGLSVLFKPAAEDAAKAAPAAVAA
jgi:hypothetical protein